MRRMVMGVVVVVLFTVVFVRTSSAANPAAIAAAVEAAKEQGLLDCAYHLGPNQCRSLDRCNRSRNAIDIAKGGDADFLEAFIGASDMQANCVRSLMGGNYTALIQGIRDNAPQDEYEDRRSGGGRTGWEICNEYNSAVMVATAERESRGYVSRGWLKLDPGSCIPWLNAPTNRAGELYIYAQEMATGRNIRKWSGGYSFCAVHWRVTNRFLKEQADQVCSDRNGEGMVGFAKVPVNGRPFVRTTIGVGGFR